MINLQFVPLSEIQRIRKNIPDTFASSKILADIFRINALYMIMRAGSGHIGTTFSAMDIITWLFTQEMKNPNEKGAQESDIYFSSKGHDVPGLYSLLIGLEKIDFDSINKLRRLNGLPGHPDIGTKYIAANTGSLGMGISKARGMAIANRLNKKNSRLYVLTGDGELQEGQIWESLQPTANGKFSEMTVIVDHNKMQSDSRIEKISGLGKLEDKFRAFGWEVARCDGHDFRALKKVFTHFKTIKDKPQILIADTVKSKGVSFMESTSFGDDEGDYKFHSGALNDENYALALGELVNNLNKDLSEAGQGEIKLELSEKPIRLAPKNPERLVDAYGDELVKISEDNKDIVVLDADLSPDCGIASFKEKFPDRFFECGIAEQDMISVSGGLALRGKFPIAHSFACFISSRPNEHIYNNSTEKTKIIYVGTLAGLLPGGPGHSHQSVRDISAMGAMPGLIAFEPCNEQESRMAIRWAVEKNKNSSYLRFVNVPLELPYKLPAGYQLRRGCGVPLVSGKDVAIVGYGPVMLKEAIKTSEVLQKNKIFVSVINLPWLNSVDSDWIKQLGEYQLIVTLDNHYLNQGQGELISSTLAKVLNKHPKIISLGVEEVPACGSNDEVLKYHKLDSNSITKVIKENYDKGHCL